MIYLRMVQMRRILTRTIVKMAVDGISLIVPRFNVSLVVSRMNNSLMVIVTKGTFALNHKFPFSVIV
jgi:hypothetical protein